MPIAISTLYAVSTFTDACRLPVVLLLLSRCNVEWPLSFLIFVVRM